MSNIPQVANGFKIRIGQYHLRIWKNGFEYGNRLGGRVVWFPWFRKLATVHRLKTALRVVPKEKP